MADLAQPHESLEEYREAFDQLRKGDKSKYENLASRWLAGVGGVLDRHIEAGADVESAKLIPALADTVGISRKRGKSPTGVTVTAVLKAAKGGD